MREGIWWDYLTITGYHAAMQNIRLDAMKRVPDDSVIRMTILEYEIKFRLVPYGAHQDSWAGKIWFPDQAALTEFLLTWS